jgi:hypothetical protein
MTMKPLLEVEQIYHNICRGECKKVKSIECWMLNVECQIQKQNLPEKCWMLNVNVALYQEKTNSMNTVHCELWQFFKSSQRRKNVEWLRSLECRFSFTFHIYSTFKKKTPTPGYIRCISSIGCALAIYTICFILHATNDHNMIINIYYETYNSVQKHNDTCKFD